VLHAAGTLDGYVEGFGEKVLVWVEIFSFYQKRITTPFVKPLDYAGSIFTLNCMRLDVAISPLID
jgi:hypothetical protein